MGFVNKVMLLGNTTREPELRTLPSGTTVCDFGMATNRVYRTTGGEEKQETVFVDCAAFGRTAEIIAEYCPRGRSLFVEGRLHYETWEDKTGSRRSKLSIIVENVQLVGSREAVEHSQRALPLVRAGRGGEKELEEKPWSPLPGRERVLVGAGASAGSGARKEATAHGEAAPANKNGARKYRREEKVRSEDKMIDQVAEEAQKLEEADLPF